MKVVSLFRRYPYILTTGEVSIYQYEQFEEESKGDSEREDRFYCNDRFLLVMTFAYQYFNIEIGFENK